MIKKLRLAEDFDVNFSLFSIISHEKSYKLCWRINKKLQINLNRVEPLTILKSGSFDRYRHFNESEKIEVVSNRSLEGYLDTQDKKVNYFLKYKNFLGPKLKGYEMPRYRSIDLDEFSDYLLLKKIFYSKS